MNKKMNLLQFLIEIVKLQFYHIMVYVAIFSVYILVFITCAVSHIIYMEVYEGIHYLTNNINDNFFSS